MSTTGNNYVLIDGSYYIFYRYYAVNVWWKLTAIPDCDSNEPFIEKFKSTFVSKIQDIDKNLKLKNTIKYVGKDCRRKDIWRTALYPAYKANRGESNSLPPFVYELADELFLKAGVKQILSYPSLEADDCIALLAKHLYQSEPDAHIWIIASDMDYLQITNDRIHLYDLKFKNICEKSTGDPLEDLFCKIVAGDKSDNIPSVFKKCGIKTAQKYFNDRDMFAKKLATDPIAQDIYHLNTTLVDFNSIPIELVEGFKQIYLSTM
jgi:5'-3' exonuclease